MEIPEQIYLLIARNLSGEASEAEQQELAEMLSKDEQLHQHYDLLTRIWTSRPGDFQQEDAVTAHSDTSRIIRKAENEYTEAQVVSIRQPRRGRWMVAASLLVLALSGWWWMKGSNAARLSTPELIEARNGSRTRSVLADGSTVWLNAGSKLYYENDFNGATREVRLEGEGYFDIVKNPSRPFIVHTSGIDIKVLGTAFNVKAYPDDKTVETTLFRGSVKVFRHEETEVKAIQLRPNEKLILAREAALPAPVELAVNKDKPAVRPLPAISTLAHIDSTKRENERIETAWIFNRLEFRGDSFEELARKLERWYDISIVFTDERVKQLSFYGTFETETVEQAFRYLKEANTFSYSIINNREIYVGSVR